MNRVKGFTLIELLIVLAIVGIISSIAYPSFKSFMIKAHRGDAQAELIKAQLSQTTQHILNPSYSTVAADIGLPATHDYYDFHVVSAGKSTYLLKAVAKNDSSQADDEQQCRTLFIDQNSFHSTDGFISNDDCW
jgi:type IV pilus assembly protein PilE